MNRLNKHGAAALQMLLLVMLVVLLFWIALARVGTTFDFSFIGTFRVRLWKGFVATLAVSGASILLSLLLGLLAAVAQSARLPFLRYLAGGYVTVIRGTPLIMQIYLFYYIIGTAFGMENRFWSGVIILSVFEGAYVAEILRGAILSQEQTQLEAARAVGFTRWQTVRFVQLPQLTARTLPALTGQCASIIKDSSLLSMIAVIELTQTIKEISATNLRLFESYFFLGALYLLLTLPITLLSRRLERRFRYED